MLKEWKKADDHLAERKWIRIHPAWCSFIEYCESLRSEEIEKLNILNGRPVMAEKLKSKVRFDE